ncbi:MAG: hypothetical protein V8R08_01235 [Coriobacteriales bacterium]
MNESQSSVRIGPISLFALIAVICLATLAVLSITTANASYRLTTLQADSMAQQYQAEIAAQNFLARIDARYADATSAATRAAQRAAAEKEAAEIAARVNPDAATGTATTGTSAGENAAVAAGSLAEALPAICAEAAAATGDVIDVAAQLDGSTVTAQFTCPSGRVLDIEVELGPGGTYRITKWNMTAKVNTAETDTLWSGM